MPPYLRVIAVAVACLAALTPEPCFAQGSRAPAPAPAPAPWLTPPPPWAAPGRLPSQPPPRLPPPSVDDYGVTQIAVARAGYSSGLHVGGGLAISYRSTTWPYDTTYGIDALEITVLTSLDHREIGWRANPFGFVFSLWSDSVFQQGYLRWNLIEFGFDYQVRDDTSRASVDTGLAFGYSVELGDGVALRVFEIGAYGGVYTKGEDANGDTRAIFDWGGTLGVGATFR